MAEFPAFGFKPRSLHKTQKHTTTQPSQELLISPGRGSLSRKGHCPGSARVQQGRCVRQLLSSSHSGNVTTDSVFLPINMHICNRNKNCTSRLPPHRFNCKINNPVIKKAGQSRKKKVFQTSRYIDVISIYKLYLPSRPQQTMFHWKAAFTIIWNIFCGRMEAGKNLQSSVTAPIRLALRKAEDGSEHTNQRAAEVLCLAIAFK